MFYMCGIYAHGGEPGDKATPVCVCTLALLDPSVFARMNCTPAYIVIAMRPLYTTI